MVPFLRRCGACCLYSTAQSRPHVDAPNTNSRSYFIESVIFVVLCVVVTFGRLDLGMMSNFWLRVGRCRLRAIVVAMVANKLAYLEVRRDAQSSSSEGDDENPFGESGRYLYYFLQC